MTNNRRKIGIDTLMPLIIFLVITLLASILTQGRVFAPNNLMNIINQSVPYFLAGLGMIFVVAVGGTDVTCGSIIGLAGTASAWAGLTLGVWAMFPAAILVGGVIGLANGVVVSRFKVPSFMCTLAMLLAIRAVLNWWLQSTVYICNTAMHTLDLPEVKLPILIVMFVIFGIVFHYTPFGEYVRAIGENELAMEFTGISVRTVKILAYTLSGLLAGVAGIFTVVRLGGASNTMGSGMEMKVMLCMFLAGIPVQGGSGTRIYKLIIGVLTYFMLDNGLTLISGSSNVNQLVRGIILILALLITRLASEQSVKQSIKKAGLSEAGT